MYLKNIYSKQLNKLSTIYNKNEANSILKILYEFLFKEPFYVIYTNFNSQILSKNELSKLNYYFNKLMQNIPIQYITHEAYFCDRIFYVNKDVLIPRGETEELVNLILMDNKNDNYLFHKFDFKKDINNEITHKKILDIGTGSGCIPITLNLEDNTLDVYAIDVFPKALKVAKKNNDILKSNVKFILDDILNPKEIVNHKFDLIVSNPPYVLESEKGSMHKNVLDNEPKEALFVPNDNPLLFYDSIVNFALNHLNKDGSIYLEINPLVANEMVSNSKKHFSNVKLLKDINNKDRFLVLNGL